MTDTLTRSAAATWVLLLTAAIVARVTLVDATATMAEYAGWALFIAGPVFIALALVRGASSRTIAEVLYDTEHPHARESR